MSCSVHQSFVKHHPQNALQKCGAQLKAKISKRKSIQAQIDRKKSLNRYVPDVTRSLFGVLKAMFD